MYVFGELTDGTPVHEVEIGNGQLTAKAIDWGAVVRDLRLAGHGPPLVLGFERLDDYLRHSPHCGAIAGRYANRIAHGRFTLDGKVYQLTRNQAGKHHLHGGEHGFSKRPWRLVEHDESGVTLELTTEDGEDGYPGRVTARCVYRVVEPATLRVELTATTDAPTVVNLVHHSYFNLDGAADVLDNRLWLAADAYTPVDEEQIPTGEICPVAGTPYDFRTPRPVRLEIFGTRIRYDTNFVMAREPGVRPAFMARLESPASGVTLEVWSTEPGLQVYDGYKIDLPVAGLDGREYGPSAGICFEPQRFPDSPNRPAFSDATLRPHERYRQHTEYRFSRG